MQESGLSLDGAKGIFSTSFRTGSPSLNRPIPFNTSGPVSCLHVRQNLGLKDEAKRRQHIDQGAQARITLVAQRPVQAPRDTPDFLATSVIPRARATVPRAWEINFGSPVANVSEISSAGASGDLRCSAGSNLLVFIVDLLLKFSGLVNVPCLGTLVTTAKQYDDPFATRGIVEPVSAPMLNPEFAHTVSKRLCISKKVRLQPGGPTASRLLPGPGDP